jgi:hypothetical protein
MDERVEHYVHACKGSKERALLLALDAGFKFDDVVCALGAGGVAIAFQCILNGWIDQGQITDAGRNHLRAGAEA